jgi:ADP-ribose pyrophosphatase
MSKKLPYRILHSEKIYEGHVITLVKDRFVLDVQKDKVVTRELVRHPGAVAILPFVDKKNILLIRQFRYAAQGDLWEIPAGTREKNERPLLCARRELEEETGFRAKHWTYWTCFFPAPGIANELMTLYKAEGLFPGRKNLDHDEWIEHEAVSLKEACAMIRRGQIRDGKTIAGILWAAAFEGR